MTAKPPRPAPVASSTATQPNKCRLRSRLRLSRPAEQLLAVIGFGNTVKVRQEALISSNKISARAGSRLKPDATRLRARPGPQSLPRRPRAPPGTPQPRRRRRARGDGSFGTRAGRALATPLWLSPWRATPHPRPPRLARAFHGAGVAGIPARAPSGEFRFPLKSNTRSQCESDARQTRVRPHSLRSGFRETPERTGKPEM